MVRFSVLEVFVRCSGGDWLSVYHGCPGGFFSVWSFDVRSQSPPLIFDVGGADKFDGTAGGL